MRGKYKEGGKCAQEVLVSIAWTCHAHAALAKEMSEQFRCEEMLPFATSAIRSAENSDKVLDKVEKETGVRLRILSGDDEARLTFLAVRRWYGWSAGRICDLDIGGGSLEMSIGMNEDPDVACSVNLGAGRLTREWFDTDPPSKKKIAMLKEFIDKHTKICKWKQPSAGTTAFIQFCVNDRPIDDVFFCKDLLEKTKVLLCPGSHCFGCGKDFIGFIRVGYVCETAVLQEALLKLDAYVREHLYEGGAFYPHNYSVGSMSVSL